MIIIMTTIYTSFLFLRGVDMLLDFISEVIYHKDLDGLEDITAYSLIVFYFLETIPPITLILVFFVKIRSIIANDKSHDTIFSNNEESNYNKIPTYDSTDTYAK
jgi:hypothetical protein